MPTLRSTLKSAPFPAARVPLSRRFRWRARPLPRLPPRRSAAVSRLPPKFVQTSFYIANSQNLRRIALRTARTGELSDFRKPACPFFVARSALGRGSSLPPCAFRRRHKSITRPAGDNIALAATNSDFLTRTHPRAYTDARHGNPVSLRAKKSPATAIWHRRRGASNLPLVSRGLRGSCPA